MSRTFERWTAPVPPMTHELGTYWDQPDPNAWAFDATSVCMPRADFKRLADYSASLPSGVYEGKIWKCRSDDGWLLCWYADPVRDEMCIYKRRILIT
jgi:hypothetical protein